MYYKIYYLLLFSLLLTACQNNQSETSIVEEIGVDTARPVTLDVLMKNEKVKIGKIQKKLVTRAIQCTGQIDIPPTAISSVHSKTEGQLTFLKYLPGDFVNKGRLLASIENPQLIEKQRMLLETKANLDFARKDFERKKILKEGQATPEKTFDESQNNYKLLQATYSGLKKELDLLGINTNVLETENKFQSTVNIYAGQSGYINQVLVNKGQMITPEIRLMDIANVNQLYLRLNVLSKDISAIQRDQSVEFTLPNSAKTFQAKVVKINPLVDDATSTLGIHCDIEKADKNNFVAGTFVNAIINTAPQELSGLPLSAVIKEGEDYFGYKIKNKEVIKMPLTNVTTTRDFVLFDGEKAGEWIIGGAYYVE